MEIQSINRREAFRYLGFGSNEPKLTNPDLFDSCERKLLAVIEPRYCYKILDPVMSLKNSTAEQEISLHHQSDQTVTYQGVGFQGCSLILPGQDIVKHLNNCEKAVLFCATLSGRVDALLRAVQIEDMAEAFVLDGMASAAIEQLCDEIEKSIKTNYPDYYFTFRYGIGYGDLPLNVQIDFITLLDATKRIGLYVNEQNLLTPVKSVTAIIGMSKEPVEKRRSSCAVCNMAGKCSFKEKGDHCGY